MNYLPSEKFCLGLTLIGGMILLTGILLPFFVKELTHDPDLISSGFVTFGIAGTLYFLARSRRSAAK